MDGALRLTRATQLLIDNYLLDDVWNLRRAPELPAKALCNPLMKKEGSASAPGYSSVIYDGDEGIFKCWYVTFDEALCRAGKAGSYQTCYAVSPDGINWRRPRLDLYASGSNPNVVLPKCGFVFKDARDTDDARRYKMLYNFEGEGGGLCAAFSPDGVHWERYSGGDRVLVPGANDTSNTAFFDERIGKYVRYGRPYILAAPRGVSERDLGFEPNWRIEEHPEDFSDFRFPPKGVVFPEYDDYLDFPECEDFINRYLRPAPYVRAKTLRLYKGGNMGCTRRVIRSESEDFIHWSTPELVLAPDELDPAKFYGMTAMPYGGMYLGLLQVYDSNGGRRVPLSHLEKDTIDLQLAFSRDGKSWERLANRPAFIQRGNLGDCDSGMIFGGNHPFVPYKDELRAYYTGNMLSHSFADGSESTLNVARVPMNRLVAREAGDEVGAFITKPFILDAPRVSANFDARRGLIRAELADMQGDPLPGHSAAESAMLRVNSLDAPLTWNANADLSEYIGRAVRLRVYLHKAKIYALRFGA